MATRSQYNTRQREQIMDFILTRKDGHFSVSDVMEYCGKNDIHIGQTTVYRHLKCEKCGKLLHLQCDMLEHIDAHLEEDHGFLLDTKRTVFYGICGDCRRKMQEKV